VNENDAVKPLRVTLTVIGVLFIVALYPLSIFWPSGWIWHATGHSDYLQMIMGVYATLGVFLLRAARNPLENLSLIWFTVWSSIVHGGIMAAQAVVEPNHRGHLVGDVPALWLIAAVLAVVTLRARMPGVATRGAT
jgi:hypothetical protein